MKEPLALFVRELANRAQSRADRAVLACAFLKMSNQSNAPSIREIADLFSVAHLAHPNVTVLRNILAKDPRVSVRAGLVRSLDKGDVFFREAFPEFFADGEDLTELSSEAVLNLLKTPLIDTSDIAEVQKMLEVYAALHVLENSMRRLIATTLERQLGTGWWEISASSAQKRKHADRLIKEESRIWLPTRSGLARKSHTAA